VCHRDPQGLIVTTIGPFAAWMHCLLDCLRQDVQFDGIYNSLNGHPDRDFVIDTNHLSDDSFGRFDIDTDTIQVDVLQNTYGGGSLPVAEIADTLVHESVHALDRLAPPMTTWHEPPGPDSDLPAAFAAAVVDGLGGMTGCPCGPPITDVSGHSAFSSPNPYASPTPLSGPLYSPP
jgi:hypothetical protein